MGMLTGSRVFVSHIVLVWLFIAVAVAQDGYDMLDFRSIIPHIV